MNLTPKERARGLDLIVRFPLFHCVTVDVLLSSLMEPLKIIDCPSSAF